MIIQLLLLVHWKGRVQGYYFLNVHNHKEIRLLLISKIQVIYQSLRNKQSHILKLFSNKVLIYHVCIEMLLQIIIIIIKIITWWGMHCSRMISSHCNYNHYINCQLKLIIITITMLIEYKRYRNMLVVHLSHIFHWKVQNVLVKEIVLV